MADQPRSLAELVADSRRKLVDHITVDDREGKRLGAKHTKAAMKATQDATAAKNRTSHFARNAAMFAPVAAAEAGDTTASASTDAGTAASAEAGDTKAETSTTITTTGKPNSLEKRIITVQ